MRFRALAIMLALCTLASMIAACSVAGDSATPTATAPIIQPISNADTATLTAQQVAPTATSTTAPNTPPTAITNATNPQAATGVETLFAPASATRPEVIGPQVLTLVGSWLGPTTLDPALIRDAEGSFISRQIFRGLVRLDDNLLVQPDLASRIDISADRMRYTFHLRESAVFHDGSPINADAVVASFNRASDPALAGGDGTALPAYLYFADIVGAHERMNGLTNAISGIVAQDATTVVISVRQPSVTFLSMMTGACALIVDAASAGNDDWWTAPNGSGPFVLEELDSSLLLLTGFDDFYDGAPSLSEVRMLQGSASAQPLNLYEGGRVDVVDVPFYSLDRVLSPTDSLYPQLRIEPQLSTTFLVMNPSQEPFDDPSLRLAIAHAFDRAKFTRVGLDDKVELAHGLVPPGILGLTWESEPLVYDLDLARSLLAEADEMSLNPTIYGSLATTIKGVLERDLNMQLDVIVPEWPLFSARLAEGSLSAFVLSWIADYPDPSNFLYSLFHSDSPDNYINYSNAVVDRLLDDAAREQVELDRANLYLQAQQALIDDGVLVPLYHDVAYVLVKPHVRGLSVTPVGLGSLDSVWIEQ